MNVIPHILFTSLFSIIVLFLLAKLMGNRQVSQMSMFDYVNGITIGSIAAEFATSLEDDYWMPLTAMVVYGVTAALISYITCKSMAARKFINGKPVVLYENGKLYEKNLAAAKLDINEFLTQCRTAGYFDLADLQTAILETNGQVSFLPLAAQRPVTPEGSPNDSRSGTSLRKRHPGRNRYSEKSEIHRQRRRMAEKAA